MSALPKGCTKAIYLAAAERVAAEYNIGVRHILEGSKKLEYRIVRWRLWADLAARGFSHNSIAKVAGYNHTAIGYALDANRRRRKIEKWRTRDAARKAYNIKPIETKLAEAA